MPDIPFSDHKPSGHKYDDTTKTRTQDLEVATVGNPMGFQQYACSVCGKQAYQVTRIRTYPTHLNQPVFKIAVQKEIDAGVAQPGVVRKVFFQGFLCQRPECLESIMVKARYS